MVDQDNPGDGIEVVRDTNFVRITADACLPFFYGRDIELALLMITSALGSQYDSGAESAPEGAVMTRGTMTVRSQYVETARLRMSPGAALSVSMNILQTLLDQAQIDEASLRSQVEALISMSSSSNGAPH